MRELSLHILDIAENSINAGAKLIEISVTVKNGVLEIKICDDGKGMSEEFLQKVVDPYSTTRTTRKVGMGIPLLKMAAETAGGQFWIQSKEGIGTSVIATFELDHIDRMPLGSLEDTIITLIADTEEDKNIVLRYKIQEEFVLDTREIRATLQEIPIYSSEILKFLKE